MPCRDLGPVEVKNVPDWMLCEAMTIIEKLGELNTCTAGLVNWWLDHKRSEEGRVKREAAQKLTDRERLALGIDSNGNPVGGRRG